MKTIAWDTLLTMAVKVKLFSLIIMILDRQAALEYQRLLNGIQKYRTSVKTRTSDYYLRRQLHRIEKGLTNKNRREVFGLDYILPLVEEYEMLLNLGHLNKDFKGYTNHLLSEYFAVTKSSDKNYIAANELYRLIEENTSSLRYQFRSNDAPGGGAFIQLVKSRKSLRNFSTRKVNNEQLNIAIDAAKHAPSGCNRQPYRFIVINEEIALGKLSKLPPGGEGNAFGANTLVFVIGDQSAFQKTSSSHEAYVDAALASMIFVLALQDMGIGSCFMNWPHIHRLNKIAYRELDLKPYEVIVTTIAVGYPEEHAEYAISQRKNNEDIFEYYKR